MNTTGTISISVTDLDGNDITDQFNIVAAGITPPIEPPIEPPPTGELIPRPIGLDYMVPGYDLHGVPDDALLWSSGEWDLPEAIDAACQDGVALYLDVPAEFVGDWRSLKLPSGLYGVEGVIIRNTGDINSGTPCGFYLVDADAVIVGIEFQNFGTVVGMSTRSMSVERGYECAWDIHGSRRSSYGTLRCIDAGTAVSGDDEGTGLPLDYSVYPESTETIGPAIWISDCRFVDCENVLFEWSDCIGIGKVDFHRNVLRGTGGAFALEGSWWTEVYAVNNDWGDCDVPGHLKASRFSTFANLGTNTGVDIEVARQRVQILNNRAHGISAAVNTDGTNAGVFADVRGCTPDELFDTDDPFAASCSCQVSFNMIVDVMGVYGQEDSNALYGKSRGFLLERNHIERCGSWWYDEKNDGAEATGIEFKQTSNMEGRPAGAALIVRGNLFIDMPPKDRNKTNQAVVGTNDVIMPLWLIGNEFTRCHISNTEGNVPGVIRHYGHAENVKIMCNVFDECDVADPANLIGLHSCGASGPDCEISNNIAYGDYTTDRRMITASSGLSGAKVGLNTLVGRDGEFAMTANVGSADGVVERVYLPPTVPT